MKTIEERADAYVGHPEEIDEFTSATIKRDAYIRGAKEQKAIDDEMLLKKWDDMTEAEYNREIAFVDWYLKNGNGAPTFSDAIEWARRELIDKACEWFGTYLMAIGCPDDWMRDSPNMESGEDRFRKAMEK